MGDSPSTQSLLCTGHLAKPFMCFISFNPHKSPTSRSSASPVERWGRSRLRETESLLEQDANAGLRSRRALCYLLLAYCALAYANTMRSCVQRASRLCVKAQNCDRDHRILYTWLKRPGIAGCRPRLAWGAVAGIQ